MDPIVDITSLDDGRPTPCPHCYNGYQGTPLCTDPPCEKWPDPTEEANPAPPRGPMGDQETASSSNPLPEYDASIEDLIPNPHRSTDHVAEVPASTSETPPEDDDSPPAKYKTLMEVLAKTEPIPPVNGSSPEGRVIQEAVAGSSKEGKDIKEAVAGSSPEGRVIQEAVAGSSKEGKDIKEAVAGNLKEGEDIQEAGASAQRPASRRGKKESTSGVPAKHYDLRSTGPPAHNTRSRKRSSNQDSG